MNTVRKFVMYGPADTLHRFEEQLLAATKPQYDFSYKNKDNDDTILVKVYEEHKKLTNSSTTLNLMVMITGDRLALDFVVTGGQLGFRGSPADRTNVEPSIQEIVYEFILEFSERHGLTIQENKTVDEKE